MLQDLEIVAKIKEIQRRLDTAPSRELPPSEYGTAFPANPYNKRIFTRTDRGLIYYYLTSEFSGPAANWYLLNKTVYDTYGRANSATHPGRAESGQSYLVQTGTFGIDTNKLYSVTDTNLDHVWIDTYITDPTIQCVIIGTLNSAVNFRSPQLTFRILDNNNFLFVVMINGVIDLRKADAGVTSTLVSTATTTADNTNYTICIVNDGLSITVYLDGVSKITHTLTGTDVKYLQYTKCGARLTRAGAPGTAARWDNWVIKEKAA